MDHVVDIGRDPVGHRRVRQIAHCQVHVGDVGQVVTPAGSQIINHPDLLTA